MKTLISLFLTIFMFACNTENRIEEECNSRVRNCNAISNVGDDIPEDSGPSHSVARNIKECADFDLTKMRMEVGDDGIVWPKGFDMQGRILSQTGTLFQHADFTHVQNLSIYQVNQLSQDNLASSYGVIKFPQDFNMTGFETEDKEIDNLDFSPTRNFTVGMLNLSDSFTGVKLPFGLNVGGLNTPGKDLSGVDFSQTTGLTIEQINNALSIRGIRFPDGFDLTGLGQTDLRNIDFSNTTGLTVAMLNAADAADVTNDGFLVNIKFPDNFDVTGLTEKTLTGIDFSNTTGFTDAMLTGAECSYMVFPDGYDVSAIPVADIEKCMGADLSQVVGLSLNQIDDMITYDRLKLPSGLNISLLEFEGKTANYMDVSRVDGLTVTHLNDSGRFRGIVLPNGFSVIGLNTRGRDLRDIDFSNTIGLSTFQLNQSRDIRKVILPNGYNVSGLFPERAAMLDHTNTVGLTFDQIGRAGRFYGKFPADFDLSPLENYNMRYYGGADLSNIKFTCQ